jgi:L-iditol 2-dehydrogenase
MKALHYPDWQTLEIADLPAPSPRPDELLIRVAACGICGSELESFRNQSVRRKPPLIMGHEFCGEVVGIGDQVSGEWLGQRIIAHSVIHCGNCIACRRGDTHLCSARELFGMHRPGAFAEFVCVPEHVAIPWPEGLTAVHASFAEPLANGINAMRQGTSNRRDRVAVIGAGPIGLMCALAAMRIFGSEVLIADLISERLEAAKKLGVAHTVNSGQTDLVTEISSVWPEKAEHVIDAVGSSCTKKLSLEIAEPGGTVVWLGLHENTVPVESYAITLQQLTVSGSYAGTLRDLRAAVDLLTETPTDLSWAKTYLLDRGETAFREMIEARGNNIKGILQISEAS